MASKLSIKIEKRIYEYLKKKCWIDMSVRRRISKNV